MKKSMRVIFLGIALMFSFSCAHIVPAQARKIPMIKVLHDGSVQEIGLERYVASVLAGEVHHTWPKEALRAQAIASRTFALRRMRERSDKPYHVQNSVMDQVFKTKTTESLVNAVRESAGLVLTVNGDLAETSFHSTCGGKTTDAKSVWGRAYTHLKGNECGYCTASPSYSWRASLNRSDLESKFSQSISSISIRSRTKDGRVDVIELKGSKTQKISGHEFRMALGPMKVKSTFIGEIKMDGNKVNIAGHGFGHGVGLCQYGALGMAKAGKNFKDILAHYYPGTQIKKLY